jgi:hypothetical protein
MGKRESSYLFVWLDSSKGFDPRGSLCHNCTSLLSLPVIAWITGSGTQESAEKIGSLLVHKTNQKDSSLVWGCSSLILMLAFYM